MRCLVLVFVLLNYFLINFRFNIYKLKRKKLVMFVICFCEREGKIFFIKYVVEKMYCKIVFIVFIIFSYCGY